MRELDRAQRWIAVALGFSIPISTALDNVLLAALLATWLAGGRWREKCAGLIDNPVALIAAALWGLLALGMLWSDGYSGDGWRYLAKYANLLLVAVLIWPMRDPLTRRYALIAFALACMVTLLASFASWFGIVSLHPQYYWETSVNAYVFKAQITHSILMAAAAFLFAAFVRHAEHPALRLASAGLAAAAALNVLVMVQGRSGQAILFALLILLLALRWQWRGFVAGALGVGALFGVAYAGSVSFHQRVAIALAEYSTFTPERAVGENNSIGSRLEFYRNTLAIVADHPLIGVGTGGFPKAYADTVRGSGRIETRNPHNQYLLTAAESGVIGLALLLALLYAQWRLVARLASPLERDLARGLVLTVVIGCLTNSMLLDHTEGLYYAWLSALLYGGLRTAPGDAAALTPSPSPPSPPTPLPEREGSFEFPSPSGRRDRDEGSRGERRGADAR